MNKQNLKEIFKKNVSITGTQLISKLKKIVNFGAKNRLEKL